ncbi:hypothetical protein C8J57DRAFT_286520 [Mycena rebaudengoi]|nr:hypothetical protein C8J57DRAFT_286520 [Mycena rebaudengoi]
MSATFPRSSTRSSSLCPSRTRRRALPRGPRRACACLRRPWPASSLARAPRRWWSARTQTAASAACRACWLRPWSARAFWAAHLAPTALASSVRPSPQPTQHRVEAHRRGVFSHWHAESANSARDRSTRAAGSAPVASGVRPGYDTTVVWHICACAPLTDHARRVESHRHAACRVFGLRTRFARAKHTHGAHPAPNTVLFISTVPKAFHLSRPSNSISTIHISQAIAQPFFGAGIYASQNTELGMNRTLSAPFNSVFYLARCKQGNARCRYRACCSFRTACRRWCGHVTRTSLGHNLLVVEDEHVVCAHDSGRRCWRRNCVVVLRVVERGHGCAA